MPTFPQNQNSAIRIVFNTGTKKETPNSAAMPRKTKPAAGSVNLSIRRAGCKP